MSADDDVEDAEEAVAEMPEVPAPRANPALLGHEAAEAALLQAYRSGRLPHAWLLTGPHGIGKATLAYRFARFLFAEGDGAGGGLFATPPASLAVAPSHPSFRLVVSGGHPDLLVVERGFDPRRKRLRSEIVAAEARTVANFLHLTPSAGAWRVVIVDGADTMNRHAANGLLKILEEPPKQAVLLLVSDNPGRLLPTIRSRCRTLALKPLGSTVVSEILQRLRPDLSASDASILTGLAEGSPGRALALAEAGGITLYRSIINLIEKLPEVEGEALFGFSERVTRSGGEDSFALLGELLPGWLARLVAFAAGQGMTVLPEEERVMRRLAARRGLDQWVEVWEKLTHLFAQADSINLDRKQVVLNAFFALEAAAR
jgi:DNA polymerase III subunit delta'